MKSLQPLKWCKNCGVILLRGEKCVCTECSMAKPEDKEPKKGRWKKKKETGQMEFDFDNNTRLRFKPLVKPIMWEHEVKLEDYLRFLKKPEEEQNGQ